MIDLKQCSLGIELGSTRIKAVLVGDTCKPVAQGDFTWENRLENGIWTYPLEEVWQGVQAVQLVGCGVIGAALVPVLVCCCQSVQVGGVICCGGGALAWSSWQRRQHPARAGLLIRQSGQAAGRAGGKAGQKKKARAVARCALLLWPSVCTGGAICCAGCVPVHIVGGGGLLPVPVPGCWRWH